MGCLHQIRKNKQNSAFLLLSVSVKFFKIDLSSLVSEFPMMFGKSVSGFSLLVQLL